jgi:hypothetical protein
MSKWYAKSFVPLIESWITGTLASGNTWAKTLHVP